MLMYWTTELADMLADAPWPATKRELIDYVNRTTGQQDLLANLNELEDDESLVYDSILDLWPDYLNPEDAWPESAQENACLFTNDGF